MRIGICAVRRSEAVRLAFTIMEVLLAVAVIGIAFVTFYVGFRQGFSVIQVSRENLRATQILQEKMELIRLFSWSQILSAPATTSFTATFYPADTSTNQGTVYNVTRTITAAPISESYSNVMRLVTVRLTWTSDNVQRQRQISTLVSQYGLHNYIYWGTNAASFDY